MSIFHPALAVCAACGHRNEVERTASVNADRRPDLRLDIIEGRFQQSPCAKCNAALRLPPHLTYLDMGRRQWFVVESAEKIADWKAAERDAFRTWEVAFGSGATPHARAMGRGILGRLVLGWPALREKLLCAEHGLDDVTLEMLKLGLMREMDAPPLADQTELRLVGADAQMLRLDWLELTTERALEGMEVPRSRYDEVVAHGDDWAELRASFEGKLLVDWRRLMFAGAEA